MQVFKCIYAFFLNVGRLLMKKEKKYIKTAGAQNENEH